MRDIEGDILIKPNMEGNITQESHADGDVTELIRIDGDIADQIMMDGSSFAVLPIDGQASASYGRSYYEVYTGPYEVTPSAHPQTLGTAGKAMTGNITVTAIPSNYGLIGWNGRILTVS